MPNPELTPDFSQWMGSRMDHSPDGPNSFRSAPQEGIMLTEEGIPETHRGKGKRKTFWSVTIRIDNFYATGTDFDRAEARNEAWAKIKELVSPLIQKFERLGLLPPT